MRNPSMNLMSSVRHLQQQYNTDKKTNERVMKQTQTHIRIKIETHEEEKNCNSSSNASVNG